MKKIFFSVLLTCFTTLSFAQIDTAFWFANPRLDPGHMSWSPAQRVQLVVVTYSESALVTITRPALGDTIFRPERVPAHSTRKINLMTRDDYKTKIETPADGAVHNNGIYVQSSEKVTVYWVSTQSNSEIYTLKGKLGLGQKFVVSQQYDYDERQTFGSSSVPYASIEVVASEDDTYVTFKTLVPTNLGPAGTYTSPRLNRGQTYAIRAAEGQTAAANHLGGTIVTATKPVAVNTTDDSATSFDCGTPPDGHKDLIGEQLVPTELAGSRYIIAANNSVASEGAAERAYFYAIEDGNTEVYASTVNGDSLVATISPGKPASMQLNRKSGTYLFTKTNQPFIVFQLTAEEGGCELSGTVLPSLDCSGSREVSYVPALDKKTVAVTIVTHTEYINSFLVNNDSSSLTAVHFYPVPGHSEWSYCSCYPLSLVGKEKNLRIVNTMGVFHFGVLDAGGEAASYGYFSNYGAIAVAFRPQQDYYYEGEDAHFHLESSEQLEDIWWEGPKGVFGVGNPDPVITDVTMEDAGRYVVHANHKDGCEILPDTFYLNVLKHVETVEVDTCLNETISIKAAGLKPYEWYKSETLLSDTTQAISVVVKGEEEYYVASHQAGFDVAKLENPIDIALHTTDTIVAWRKEISHLIVGNLYRWTISVTTLVKSTAPNKLLLHAGDTTTGIWAISNNVGEDNTYVLDFTPKHESGVFKVIVAKPKDGRAIRINSMSLVPIIDVQEDFHITARDCGQDPPKPKPCPELKVINKDTIVCDTLLPMTWHGFYYEQPGMQHGDTIKSPRGCDSILYTYTLMTMICYPETCVDALTQRWNDIIAVKNAQNNGGYNFVAFAWYRNEQLLPDEKKSYIYLPEQFTPGDVFSVVMQDANGRYYRACDFMPEHLNYEGDGLGEVTKVVEDGQLYIIRQGVKYNAQGARL